MVAVLFAIRICCQNTLNTKVHLKSDNTSALSRINKQTTPN